LSVDARPDDTILGVFGSVEKKKAVLLLLAIEG
jgi:hypothetical protein